MRPFLLVNILLSPLLAWCAPEILRGVRGANSPPADVFSFGVVLWELMTARRPWSELRSPLQIVSLVGYQRKRLPLAEPSASAGASAQEADRDGRIGRLLFRLLRVCGAEEPSGRPAFAQMAGALREELPQR